MVKYIVFAPSLRWYEQWRRDNNVPKDEAFYASEVRHLMGRRFPGASVITLGGSGSSELLNEAHRVTLT